MGYSIQAINRKGEEIAYFHLHHADGNRLLHKALGIPTIGVPEYVRSFSKGKLLEAKSFLVKLQNCLEEIDFIDRCLTEVNDSHENILITFN